MYKRIRQSVQLEFTSTDVLLCLRSIVSSAVACFWALKQSFVVNILCVQFVFFFFLLNATLLAALLATYCVCVFRIFFFTIYMKNTSMHDLFKRNSFVMSICLCMIYVWCGFYWCGELQFNSFFWRSLAILTKRNLKQKMLTPYLLFNVVAQIQSFLLWRLYFEEIKNYLCYRELDPYILEFNNW